MKGENQVLTQRHVYSTETSKIHVAVIALPAAPQIEDSDTLPCRLRLSDTVTGHMRRYQSFAGVYIRSAAAGKCDQSYKHHIFPELPDTPYR